MGGRGSSTVSLQASDKGHQMSWDLFLAFVTEQYCQLYRWQDGGGGGEEGREDSLDGLVPPVSTTTFSPLLNHKSTVPPPLGSSPRLNQSDYPHPMPDSPFPLSALW